MAQSLQEQVKDVKTIDEDIMSLPDEDFKEEVKIESIELAAKEIFNKLKLVDTFAKAIDRLVSLSNSEKPENFFLLIESSVFESVK
jgi:hypothetical protein